MKKKILLVLLLFALLTSIFCSCRPTNALILEKVGLRFVGGVSLPGMFSSDRRGTTCKIIEKDNQGRTLFEYGHINTITNNPIDVLSICQVNDYDNEYVYFYEDIHFLICPYDKDDLELLKQRNDWNKPLDYSKMSRRDYDLGTSHFGPAFDNRSAAEIRDIFANHAQIDESYIKGRLFVDVSNEHQVLYLVKTVINDTQEFYILYMDKHGNNVRSMKIENNIIDYEAFIQFKKDCGWAYPKALYTADLF